jgi:Co/Zn/Cd efflux system component
VLAAFVSGLALFVVAGRVIVEAIDRLSTRYRYRRDQ